MAWTNAFNIGSCELQLIRWFQGEPFLVPQSQWANYGASITVAAGVVTVNIDLPGGASFSVYVKPNFAPDSKPVRITSLSADFGAGSGSPYLNAYRDIGSSGSDMGGTIPLTTSNPVTPDPVDFPEYDWDVAGIAFGRELA